MGVLRQVTYNLSLLFNLLQTATKARRYRKLNHSYPIEIAKNTITEPHRDK